MLGLQPRPPEDAPAKCSIDFAEKVTQICSHAAKANKDNPVGKNNWFNIDSTGNGLFENFSFYRSVWHCWPNFAFYFPKEGRACNLVSLLPPAHSTAPLRDLPLSPGVSSHHSANSSDVFAVMTSPRTCPSHPFGFAGRVRVEFCRHFKPLESMSKCVCSLTNLPCSQSTFSHHHSNDPGPRLLSLTSSFFIVYSLCLI